MHCSLCQKSCLKIMPVGPENLNIYAIERFSKNKYFELPFAEETRGVILNPFPMNDIFKIFDERF